jgi:hypothetical protein
VGSARIGRLLGRGGMGESTKRSTQERTPDRMKVLRSRRVLKTAHDSSAKDNSRPLSVIHTVYIFGSEEIAGIPVISMGCCRAAR